MRSTPRTGRRPSRSELAARLDALRDTIGDPGVESVREHEMQTLLLELEMQVHELRESRAALEESHERYVDLYDFAPVGYLTLGEHGAIRELNLTAARMLGVERGALVERALAPWIASADLMAYRSLLRQALAAGDKSATTLQVKTRQGGLLPVEAIASCLRDESTGDITFRLALTDLTERRVAEADLDRFFRLSTDLLAVAGNDGFLKRVNPAWERVLGYTAGELLSRPFASFVHPEDRGTLSSRLLGVGNEDEGEFGGEVRCLSRDQEVVWLAWSTVTVGETIYCVARDTSAEVAAKELSRRQHQWLQEMVRLIPVPLYLVECESGEIVSMSASAEAQHYRFTDLPDLARDTGQYCVDAEGRALPVSEWPRMRAARGEELDRMPCHWRTPKGIVRLLISSHQLPKTLDHPAMAIILAQDVTPLQKAQERLKTAVAVAKVGFYDWDVERDRLSFSGQMRRMWGVRSGLDLDRFLARNHPEDRDEHRRLILLALEHGSRYRLEHRVQRADGTTLWVETRAKVSRDGDGRATRLFGTSVDISVRKQGERNLAIEAAERELVTRELQASVTELELERELREVFVATLSHDLRNPLTAAKMCAQMLERGIPDPAKLQRIAGRIATSMDRADQMIRDLLDASRIKGGQAVPVDRLECDLETQASIAVDELTSIHGDRFVLDSSHEPQPGWWDRNALIRMIQTLPATPSSTGRRRRRSGSRFAGTASGSRSPCITAATPFRSRIRSDCLKPFIGPPRRRKGASSVGASVSRSCGAWPRPTAVRSAS